MRDTRIFNTYQEFYSLTRPLTDLQRTILFDSLPVDERRRLARACKSEGWADLLARNKIDKILDQIKEDFGEDLILIRIEILRGRKKKVRRAFWEYVNDILSEFSLKEKQYVLEGIAVKSDKNNEWIYLVPSDRRNT